jgi:hypothetical protein
VLAKVGIIGLIKKLFSGKHELIITPQVYEELRVPKEYGYTYPDEIFKNIEVLTVESQEQKLYMELLNTNPALGKGELESITEILDIVKNIEVKDKRIIKLALILT